MYYDEKEYIVKISQQSGADVFLPMLQEECSELIQAISKYMRASGKVHSPTVLSCSETMSGIREEITDVQMMIDGVLYTLFGIEPGTEQTRDEYMERKKWVRWLRRLDSADYSD